MLSSEQARKIGIALVLCFVLTLCLPFLEMRILENQSQFFGWQVWLISFYAFTGDELGRYWLLPALSAASLFSVSLCVGLIVQRWAWIRSPHWRWFSLLMCVGYLYAPWLLKDPARYLLAYYLGLVFHAGLWFTLIGMKRV